MTHRGISQKRELARKLRREFTGGERAAWHFLRRNGMGVHFTRECVVRGYIVDFACRSLKIAVEIDGGIHRTERAMKYDWERDERLGLSGWAVVRFPNHTVCTNPEKAKQIISECIEKKRADAGLVGRIR